MSRRSPHAESTPSMRAAERRGPAGRVRALGLILLLALVGLAFAQIGDGPESLYTTLGVTPNDAGELELAEGFVARLEVRGGLVYVVEAEGTFDEAGRQAAASLVAAASGFGEGIEQPVLDFLASNLGNLAGSGTFEAGVEQYVLELDIAAGDAPYDGSLRFSLREIADEGFPEPAATLGPDDARFVIREFSDFQCPFCAQFAQGTLTQIKDSLLARGDVRFEYHHFPLQSIHANAVPAAEASECVLDVAGDEAFWQFHDALFERQRAWQGLGEPEAYFARTASELGADGDAVRACLDEGRFNADVLDAYDAAVALRLTGTPTVFVNGFKVQQAQTLAAYERLFELVDAFGDAAATP